MTSFNKAQTLFNVTGMYAQQPVMGMYAQPGYNPQIQQAAAPVYGMTSGVSQAGQAQQAAPPPPHRPFI